jgi:glycerophosphoryl diester phosphodiesterase
MLLVAHRTPPSREGCERLAAEGAQVFEIDVQVDALDRLVVSHFQPFGGGLLQRDNWRFRWHTGATRDPRVSDMADAVPNDCLLLLDLKEKTADRRARLVTAIAESLPDRARFRICSPRPDDLAELRSAGFRTWRTVGERRELSAVLDGDELADDAVTIRHSLLTEALIARLHQLVPQVIAWTVNDAERARQLRQLGVDGLTTDRPSVLRA